MERGIQGMDGAAFRVGSAKSQLQICDGSFQDSGNLGAAGHGIIKSSRPATTPTPAKSILIIKGKKINHQTQKSYKLIQR